MMKLMMRGKEGYTLMELLMVVSMVAILVAIGLTNWRGQVAKGHDSRRKADIHQLSVVFEDYYNDHGCYPPKEYFDSESDCDSGQLEPYIKEIPCDPGGEPYDYHLSDDECSNYWIYTDLDNDSDPIIAEVGCDENGCGSGGNYDYGKSSDGDVDSFEWQSEGDFTCRPASLDCDITDPLPEPWECPRYETYQECAENCYEGSDAVCPGN